MQGSSLGIRHSISNSEFQLELAPQALSLLFFTLLYAGNVHLGHLISR